MTTKYLELDSTYRNRQSWPRQAMFVSEITRPGDDDDPIAEAMPSIAWQGGNVAVTATVVSRTNSTFVITAPGLPATSEYLTNATMSPPDARIVSYAYLGANMAEVTLATPITTAITTGTIVTIADNTSLALSRVFVPGAGIIPANYYSGQLLYDETLGLHSKIHAYDPVMGVVTVESPIPGWTPTDSFSIRRALPAQIGTTGAGSTANAIAGLTAVQTGSFIRLLPGGQTRRIVTYDPTSSTATVYPPFTTPTALVAYEILIYSGSNVRQLTYSGTSQVECVNSTVRLLNLILPNKPLSVGTGGTPLDYPYLYVRLTPRDSSIINVNCSNNPNATTMLFRATYSHHSNTSLPFVKFVGDAAVRVRFKVDSDLMFQVTLPNGQTVEYVQTDTVSPSMPDPTLQISALFEIVRDHGLGTTRAYGDR